MFYDRYPTLADEYNINLDDYDELEIGSPERLQAQRERMLAFNKACNNMPVTGILFGFAFAFCVIIVLAVYSIYSKHWLELLFLLIPLLNMAMCYISPVNGSNRYALPLVVILPYFWGRSFCKKECPAVRRNVPL